MVNPFRRAVRSRSIRVLSVDPRIRRTGFGCFEDGALLDWGLVTIGDEVPHARAKQAAIARVIEMLDRYSPGVLILPRIGPGGIRRSQSVRDVIRAVSKEALRRGLEIQTMTTKEVKNRIADRFGTFPSNKEVARQLLVREYPPLEARGLRARKAWDTEQYNTPLFDAVAMYCAWYRPQSS